MYISDKKEVDSMNRYDKAAEMLKKLAEEKGRKITVNELRIAYSKEFGIIDSPAVTRGIKSLASLELISVGRDGKVEIL